MPILTGIRTLYACRAAGRQRDVHPVDDAALVWQGETIEWVGPARDLPARWRSELAEDAGGCLVVPGLIDCHTHLAFGGWRADEFVRRIEGASYQEIARAGGGIRATMRMTRDASSPELVSRCLAHLTAMIKLGVTGVEAKSGYGLSLEHELRLLDVYRVVAERSAARVVPTLLAAHAVPPEFDGRRTEYVDLVVERIVPQAAAKRLARFCDVFVDEGAFTIPEARRVLEAGRVNGLAPKLHADQLTNSGGAELAAAMGAVSADHLERVSDAGILALAGAEIVAVSLPLASLYLGGPALPARRLIEAGVAVAVATDFNPGSAPSFHLPLAMMLACTLQRMTPAEALKGATILAARAVGLETRCGSLEAGKSADFALIEAESLEQWLYHFVGNACVRTVIRGADAWRQAVSERQPGVSVRR